MRALGENFGYIVPENLMGLTAARSDNVTTVVLNLVKPLADCKYYWEMLDADCSSGHLPFLLLCSSKYKTRLEKFLHGSKNVLELFQFSVFQSSVLDIIML